MHFGPVFTFLYYLTAFCSRPEEAVDAMSGKFVGPLVLDKCEKFHDIGLNRSREIPPEAVLINDGSIIRIRSSTIFPLQLPTG